MRAFLNQFKSRDNHSPLVQFIKYGIAGVLSTGVHIACFYFMALKFLPALSNDDVIAGFLHLTVPAVSNGLRARNSMIDNTVAFLFSNLTAYVINVWWVFETGRHHRVLEFFYFYLVSGISVVVGSLLMGVLIKSFGITTTHAFAVNVGVSLLINFVLRKHLVFKG
jgi:putative flippase GtrA